LKERIGFLTIISLLGVSLVVAQNKEYQFNLAKYYQDGVQLIYALEEKDKKGNVVRKGVLTYKITVNGDIIMIKGLSSNESSTEVNFQYDVKTNIPISSYFKKEGPDNLKEINVEFKKDKILITKDGIEETITKKGIVYDAESSAFLFSDYPFKSEDIIYFKLLVDYENVYTIAAQKIGEEKIEVPMGEIDCYKVNYKATGGIMIKLFAPTINIWISKENHNIVKFVDEDVILTLIDYKQ